MPSDNENNGKKQSSTPIRRATPGQPVYARSHEPEIDFCEVVGLAVGRPQSSYMSLIELLVDFSLSRRAFEWEGHTYQLGVRSGAALLEKWNATVKVGSRYHGVVQTPDYSEIFTREATRSTSVKADASVEVGTQIAGPNVAAALKPGHDRNSTSRTKATGKRPIDKIWPAGNDGWQFAFLPEMDPSGDNRSFKGPLLENDKDGKPRPLCVLEALDEAQPVGGVLRVRLDEDSFAFYDNGDARGMIDKFFKAINSKPKEKRLARQIIASSKGDGSASGDNGATTADKESEFKAELRKVLLRDQTLRQILAGLALTRSPNETGPTPQAFEAYIAEIDFVFEPDLGEPDPGEEEK